MKVHHIGYLVKSIKRSIEKFEKLGYKIETEIISDSVRKIDICFLLNPELIHQLLNIGSMFY